MTNNSTIKGVSNYEAQVQDSVFGCSTSNLALQSNDCIPILNESNNITYVGFPNSNCDNSQNLVDDINYNSSEDYAVSFGESLNNCQSNISEFSEKVNDSIRGLNTNSPPSYAAHFEGSCVSRLKDKYHYSDRASNTSSIKILPPYKQSSLVSSSTFSNILHNSTGNLKDGGIDHYSYCSPDTSPCTNTKIPLSPYHLSKNFHLNNSLDDAGRFYIYPTDAINLNEMHDAATDNCADIIDCTYPRDEPRDYSSNSISNRKSKEEILYVNDFLESCEHIKRKEKSNISYSAFYLERKKLAQSSLNDSEGSYRSEILKNKFWIIDDEPIIQSESSMRDSDLNIDSSKTIESTKKKKQPKELICHVCGKIFRGRSSLSSHIALHTGVKAYKCTYCSSSFTQSSALKSHIRTHTLETPYKCSICPSAFKTSSALKQHGISHSDLRLNHCSICSKPFKTKVNLQNHIKTHTSGPFNCLECPKVFGLKQALAKHVYMVHRAKEIYKCEICPKSYSFKSLLTQHKRIHSGEEPYSCSVCGASFVWKSGYSAHLKTHLMKLSCDVCEAKFVSLKKLHRHKLKHSYAETYPCEKCGKVFKKNYLLKAHLKKHEIDIKCNICSASFITEFKLRIHKIQHNKTCDGIRVDDAVSKNDD